VLTLVAGVDIGNNSTEVALAEVDLQGGVRFLATALVPTTGIKGTQENSVGVLMGVQDALRMAGRRMSDLKRIYLNEATPVITDVAMETLTETVITESTLIGHNPNTPGGVGMGIGRIVRLERLPELPPGDKVIAVIGREWQFADAATAINRAVDRGVDVQAAIAAKDDGVLIVNRLVRKIPVVDEVTRIDQVPLEVPGAVEVAEPGQYIRTLSNPYGIATIFSLTPEETQAVVPVARALVGNRSAVVIKTPKGEVKARTIPAGTLTVIGEAGRLDVDVNAGAAAIMQAVEKLYPLRDVIGEAGTNVGGMMQRVRQTMGDLTQQSPDEIRIQDVLATDTFVPVKVEGGLAEEFSQENAVVLAAMVGTTRRTMQLVAEKVQRESGVVTEVAGREAEVAILGALTTPGTDTPLAILDMGGGSTDAALMTRDGVVKAVHMAGAGELVTMLINSELGLNDRDAAEAIKRYPLARSESLYHIRLEDGGVRFFEEALDPKLFGRLMLITPEGLEPLYTRHSLDHVVRVRREAKRKVFVTNALRALRAVAPGGNIRAIPFVVMVGGSALDFEIPGMISEALAEYGVVAGSGNIRGTEGPRNAVATGIVLSRKGTLRAGGDR